jgi:signal transduction histidine kinase
MMSTRSSGPADAPRLARRPSRVSIRWAGVFLAGFALGATTLDAQEASHKRVLFLHSFGPNFAPFDEFAFRLQTDLARLSPTPVEFFEASLETARFARTNTEDPLADYLNALFQESGIDLVVSIGGPAGRFCLTYRERLFPSTPLLTAGLERRWLGEAAPPTHAASITVALDFPAVIDSILHVLPNTTDIVVVMGGSSLDKFWVEEMSRDFQRFTGRVRFTWFNEFSLEEMRERVSVLPPHTAIFYGLVAVDGAGVPHEHDQALERLRAVSNAPIFGLFDTEMGRGIVGGPLLSIPETSRRAAETALRLLSGEAPENIRTEPLPMGAPLYDFRELERWEIPEEQLPQGSTVLFRPPSLWERYKGPLIIGLSVVGLQTALIAGLLLQRARRRRAEEEASALSRRLLTVHEDERRRLARELHDDLSQRLARLAIDAAQVERQIEGTSAEGLARSIRQDAARLGDDVHALSYRLHPSVLEHLGLSEALEAECDLFSRRESIRAELRTFDLQKELPRDAALCLFRIAQEALHNVVRHARASRVNLSLVETDGGVQLTVNDEGAGFNPEQKTKGTLGHGSMRERVRLVHGTLDIESAPGRGTTVRAWVPWKADAL